MFLLFFLATKIEAGSSDEEGDVALQPEDQNEYEVEKCWRELFDHIFEHQLHSQASFFSQEGHQDKQRPAEMNSRLVSNKERKYLIELSSQEQEAVLSSPTPSAHKEEDEEEREEGKEKKKKKKTKKKKNNKKKNEEGGGTKKELTTKGDMVAENTGHDQGSSVENGKKDMETVEDQEELKTDNQAELIAAAFADDEVMDDFSAIKEAEVCMGP